MLPVGSGGRTRTPKDRTRTCCVANYTTPEWAAVSLAAGVAVPDSEPGRAQSREGHLAPEQMHRVEEREPRRSSLDRDVQQLHDLARLEAERVDRRAQVQVLHGPGTRLHV